MLRRVLLLLTVSVVTEPLVGCGPFEPLRTSPLLPVLAAVLVRLRFEGGLLLLLWWLPAASPASESSESESSEWA